VGCCKIYARVERVPERRNHRVLGYSGFVRRLLCDHRGQPKDRSRGFLSQSRQIRLEGLPPGGTDVRLTKGITNF